MNNAQLKLSHRPDVVISSACLLLLLETVEFSLFLDQHLQYQSKTEKLMLVYKLWIT